MANTGDPNDDKPNYDYKLAQNPKEVENLLAIMNKNYPGSIPAWIAIQIIEESY